MPDFACRIRIRPRYKAHGRLNEEWRTVIAPGPDGAMAQVYAVGEVSRENPGCSVSAHGAEMVVSDEMEAYLEPARQVAMANEPKKGGWPKGKSRKAA